MTTDDDGTSNWSELVLDTLSLVLKRLSFTDFARAKTVCSSWYIASKSCSPRKNHTPWLILNEDTHWLLFNSEEEKLYRTQYFGRFAECRILATCGSWVLVFDKEINFYIINPFTPKLIRLPPIESNRSAEFNISGNFYFDIRRRACKINRVTVGAAVLWVDEETKDYLVVWSFTHTCYPGSYICYCTKRKNEWFEIPPISRDLRARCLDMAYKDKKLYIHSFDGTIRILDFSLGDLPIEIVNHPYAHRPFDVKARTAMRLTTSGDVLMILHGIPTGDRTRLQVYKLSSTQVCSRETTEAFWLRNVDYWERVHSLEDEEALVWDSSVTLPTKGVSGIKKDSIYYCHTSTSSIREVAAYEIPTHKISAFAIPKQTSKPIPPRGLLLGDARWFVPCFGAE